MNTILVPSPSWAGKKQKQIKQDLTERFAEWLRHKESFYCKLFIKYDTYDFEAIQLAVGLIILWAIISVKRPVKAD